MTEEKSPIPVFSYEIQISKDGRTWHRDTDTVPGFCYVPDPLPYDDIAKAAFSENVDVDAYRQRSDLYGVRVSLWYDNTINARYIPELGDEALAIVGVILNENKVGHKDGPRVVLGELFKPSVTSYPHGSVHIMMNRDAISFMFAHAGLSRREIDNWGRGGCRFGWVDADTAAELIIKPGREWPYADVSVHPHYVPLEDRGLPGMFAPDQIVVASGDDPTLKNAANYGEGTALATLFLVEATTGIVVAMHGAVWPPDFYSAVRATWERMMLEPHDPAAEQAALARLHRFSPMELFHQRAQARCETR